jgi:ribonuclease HII
MKELMGESNINESDLFDDHDRVVGFDETGRGALAGPMYVGGCALQPMHRHTDWYEAVDDSKRCTVHQRSQLAEDIRSDTDWAVVGVEPWTIDEYGVNRCVTSATQAAIKLISRSDDAVVVDGDMQPQMSRKVIHAVRGDRRFKSVGAASILAKTYRDSRMIDMHFDHPAYQWEDNVGYGTGDHRVALNQHGPTLMHRMSFDSVGALDHNGDRRTDAARSFISDPSISKIQDQPPIWCIGTSSAS